MVEWLRNLCAETFQEKWRGKVSVATLALTNQLSIRFVESVCSGNLQESGPWNFLKPNDPKYVILSPVTLLPELGCSIRGSPDLNASQHILWIRLAFGTSPVFDCWTR